ncbi:MAG TPA: valine--tRNA ligase [Phycisphaerales bacterium]|nr:valine--tRNA ligase [Phycisphaerales bacterium]HMP37171.1 valine--tRNA ligase [Phycisphaerales bacterium]
MASTPPSTSPDSPRAAPASATPGFELAKAYAPADAEPAVRRRWEEARAFHVDPTADGPPFCILIPPPNVTAALHLGHAFNNTLQDILVRVHRMRGDRTLWMPGTDHAGIATQTVVEKRLLQEGKRRTDFSREAFVARVQEWKDEYEATILGQLALMGCSCDFERTRFTMDGPCSVAVREAFFRLFRDGLIYRGKRLVNWDPVSQTALADDEVEMEELDGAMHFLRYPLVGDPLPDGTDCVVVATTRPETMLGDTAVAVNPRDPRAAALRGRSVRLPIVERVVPIIEDDHVVMPVEFGGDPADPKAQMATGFLKVTPAHDPNDWEIGQRHGLPVINVLAPDATISIEHGWGAEDAASAAAAGVRHFIGLPREAARERVVKWFRDEKLGGRPLLEGIRPWRHAVGHSYRSHVPIEPWLSDQWYVRVTDDRLRGAALRAMAPEQYDPDLSGPVAEREAATSRAKVEAAATPAQAATPRGDGELRIHPARYAKSFQLWHENLRDWCISRQLWWGHRIPVWAGPLDRVEPEWQRRVDAAAMAAEFTEIIRQRFGEERAVVLRVADPTLQQASLSGAAQPRASGYVCVRRADDRDLIEWLESRGFEQDPDVLDTWFSSALWPLSTLGWPDASEFPDAFPEGGRLLESFNPSSVLFTAREILTLWVSRMVMFNRHFRGGALPFTDVFVHAVIQDGFGQKMSKSLANGIDPRDVIATHGADAMRFVMAQLSTAAQDVRLPVDMIDPHSGETFTPATIVDAAGHVVAAPIQVSPKDPALRMASAYGVATGQVRPSAELPLALNTSARFDAGRNFCNKLWNATRFALGCLVEDGAEGDIEAVPKRLVDRWIVSRLHRTLHAVEDAADAYQFSTMAEALYDFTWRELCDWYLEAAKPTIRTDPAQRQVLRSVLDATLRLLHPVIPFVTETLWPSLQHSGSAGLAGVKLPPSPLLATAAWPDIACRVDDDAACREFTRVQELVSAIRNLRGERQVPPKRRIVLHAPDDVLALIAAAEGVVETLAGLERVERHGRGGDGDRAGTGDVARGAAPGADAGATVGARVGAVPGTGIGAGDPGAARTPSPTAVPFPFEGRELFVDGLVDLLDADSERKRLDKLIDDLRRRIAGFRGKLENAGYVAKAPASVVEETRSRMTATESELAAAERARGALG